MSKHRKMEFNVFLSLKFERILIRISKAVNMWRQRGFEVQKPSSIAGEMQSTEKNVIILKSKIADRIIGQSCTKKLIGRWGNLKLPFFSCISMIL